MLLTSAEDEGEVRRLYNWFQTPSAVMYITDRSNAILLLWVLLLCVLESNFSAV